MPRWVRTYETVTIGYRSETRYDTVRYVSGSESYTYGRESLGNGYFRDRTCTRSVWSTRRVSRTVQVPITERRPVCGTWYDYKVDRGTEFRRERSSGADDDPFWPDISLSPGEREGTRAESYRYSLLSEDGETTSAASLPNEWMTLDEGDEIIAVRNFWGC